MELKLLKDFNINILYILSLHSKKLITKEVIVLIKINI